MQFNSRRFSLVLYRIHVHDTFIHKECSSSSDVAEETKAYTSCIKPRVIHRPIIYTSNITLGSLSSFQTPPPPTSHHPSFGHRVALAILTTVCVSMNTAVVTKCQDLHDWDVRSWLRRRQQRCHNTSTFVLGENQTRQAGNSSAQRYPNLHFFLISSVKASIRLISDL